MHFRAYPCFITVFFLLFNLTGLFFSLLFPPLLRLCLSITDFHPDTWNPAWSVSTILTGLLSFMVEKGPTLGSIETSDYAVSARRQPVEMERCDNLSAEKHVDNKIFERKIGFNKWVRWTAAVVSKTGLDTLALLTCTVSQDISQSALGWWPLHLSSPKLYIKEIKISYKWMHSIW